MKPSKRQELPAGLWVVATPIGNLGDLSPRAAQALGEADVILCEDTRRTGTLLAAAGIESEARLRRMDAHASEREVARAVGDLRDGKRLALVTDAGTPSISDPGARLVQAAHEAGIQVTPIPGASAPAALLSAAGFTETSFVFR